MAFDVDRWGKTREKGETYIHTDKDGNKTKMESKVKYLGKFVITKVQNGKATGYISIQTGNNKTGKLYKAWKYKPVMFSGSRSSGPINNGEYSLDLSKYVDNSNGIKINENGNPAWIGGYLEKLPTKPQEQGKFLYNTYNAWGFWRIHLNPSQALVDKYGLASYGKYIHGRGNPKRRFTLSCIADPTNSVFYKLRSIMRFTSGTVPFLVTGSSQ